MTDVGLYVHVPFCARKCGYCDFYSLVPAETDVELIVDCLPAELTSHLERKAVHVETIFVGGGTPTFLALPMLEKLLAPLAALARAHGVAEFSVEVNPGTLDDAKAAVLRAAGVDRISLGAQSFHRRELAVLDRRHDPEQIAAGAEIIHRAGFAHFNLDLIFGIPGQTIGRWRDSLRWAIKLRPDHLACYGLTYEPGTPLDDRRRKGQVEPLSEKQEARLYTTAVETLEAAGYAQYEISNFARPGGQCRHNLRYWQNLPTLGIGPAAASYLDGRRWRNVPDVTTYFGRIREGLPAAVEVECLSPL